MKTKDKLLLVLAMILVLLPAAQLTANAMPSNWDVIWSDEFNGPYIDPGKWSFNIGNGAGGWNNNELEYYTDRRENARIENGVLVLEARKESYQGFSYTSARLKTQGRFSRTYGRFEARIKFPSGQGIWPAFWMLGDSYPLTAWPKCGEIDIAELIGGGEGRDNKVHGVLHWDNNGYRYIIDNFQLMPGCTFADDYHIFAVEWDQNEIRWYVDDIQYLTANIAGGTEGTEELHQPFHMILSLAVGGNWPGLPNASTVFPQKMYVDYVRVYGPPSANPSPTRTPSPVKPAVTPTATRTHTPPPQRRDKIAVECLEYLNDLCNIIFVS